MGKSTKHTPTKKKRAPKARAASARPKRTRARPRQIYLSDEEDAIFGKMLKRQNVNASQLVRDWLLRAEAQYQRRHKNGAPPPSDPRQLRIIEAAALS
jgi:hypothetical protein